MIFIGKENYKYTNPYSFPTPPRFSLKYNAASNCQDFVKTNFTNGNTMLNISQILQWCSYLLKNEKTTLQSLYKRIQIFLSSNTKKVAKQVLEKAKFNIVKKIVKKNDPESESLRNEYFVGIYGLNYLRLDCANFGFYYYLVDEKDRISVYQEYISGISFSKFMKKMSKQIVSYSPAVGETFLSCFLQNILALEYAQSTLQFTHFDLHLENIMLRNNETRQNVEIPYFDKYVVFDKPKFISTIIDFGFSTIRKSETEIFSNFNTGFPEYGYYPFFLSGTDNFRVLSTFYINTLYRNNQFEGKINVFSRFVLEKFYNINVTELISNLKLFSSNYANITFFSQVYKTPNQLFNFLLKNEKYICQLFKIAKFPLRIQDTKSMEFHDESTKNCIKNVFCVEEEQNLKTMSKLYSFINKEHKSDKKLEEILHRIEMLQIKKIPIPRLIPSHIYVINKFVYQYAYFLSDYEEIYYEIYIKKAMTNAYFQKNIEQLTFFYRTVLSCLEFRDYLANVSNKNAKLLSRSTNYIKKMNSVFL